MKIRTRVILAISVVVVAASTVAVIAYFQFTKINNLVRTNIPGEIATLSKASRLDSLALLIRYYDEILTQSARNYAFTGNIIWRDRYNLNVPKLDATIKESIALGDDQDKQTFASIDTSNLILIDLEQKAMDFVDKKDRVSAVQILEGEEYVKQKKIYKDGLTSFVLKQGHKYDEASVVSTQKINTSIAGVQSTITQSIWIIVVAIILGAGTSIIFMIIVLSTMINSIQKLQNFAHKIADGSEDEQLVISSKDEIGDLARSFDQMVEQLRAANKNVEKKVSERTAELEQLNKSMVGRELKMIELKKELDLFKNNK